MKCIGVNLQIREKKTNHKEEGEFMEEIHIKIMREQKRGRARQIIEHINFTTQGEEVMICHYDQTIEVDGVKFSFEELDE